MKGDKMNRNEHLEWCKIRALECVYFNVFRFKQAYRNTESSRYYAWYDDVNGGEFKNKRRNA